MYVPHRIVIHGSHEQNVSRGRIRPMKSLRWLLLLCVVLAPQVAKAQQAVCFGAGALSNSIIAPAATRLPYTSAHTYSTWSMPDDTPTALTGNFNMLPSLNDTSAWVAHIWWRTVSTTPGNAVLFATTATATGGVTDYGAISGFEGTPGSVTAHPTTNAGDLIESVTSAFNTYNKQAAADCSAGACNALDPAVAGILRDTSVGSNDPNPAEIIQVCFVPA